MCGITGIFDTRGRRDIDRSVLTRMNESQHHRGPDEGGLHIEPGVGLGHRRLSIIDVHRPAAAVQRGRLVVVVFNGEIYNYQELIPELAGAGPRLPHRSDTEVIVHAWERGARTACSASAACSPSRCGTATGRRSFWRATARRQAALLRAAARRQLIFGSELKSLLAHGGLRSRHRSACRRGVLRARLRGRAAHHLPSGVQAAAGPHSLLLKRGEAAPEPRPYWDVRFSSTTHR
jgi:asparagine synthase (glutamine-hydrolysing)